MTTTNCSTIVTSSLEVRCITENYSEIFPYPRSFLIYCGSQATCNSSSSTSIGKSITPHSILIETLLVAKEVVALDVTGMTKLVCMASCQTLDGTGTIGSVSICFLKRYEKNNDEKNIKLIYILFKQS